MGDYLDPNEYTLNTGNPEGSGFTNWWDMIPNGQESGTGPNPYGTGTTSTIVNLLKKYASKSNNLADAGKIAGAFSQGEKANRVVRGNFTQDYDKLMLAAQAARNSNESDALSKLQQTEYIKNGGSTFKPPTLSINGKTYNTPDLGFGPKPTTDTEKAGAADLQGQLQARLKPGGSYSPTSLDSYANPGLAENIGSYGAVGLNGLATLNEMRGGGEGGNDNQQSGGHPSTGQQIMGGVGTAATVAGLVQKAGLLGHAAPAASTAATAAGTAGSLAGNIAGRYAIPGLGAAMGVYGLSKNEGGMSNVMNGAGTGASIGTMVMPGIGTAVGAGAGALYGALQNAFTVTNKEKKGRAMHSGMVDSLDAGASEGQMAEAKSAGWADPKQALSVIVMRDAMVKQGMDPAQASQKALAIKNDLYKAEGHGTDSVTNAAKPISYYFK